MKNQSYFGNFWEEFLFHLVGTNCLILDLQLKMKLWTRACPSQLVDAAANPAVRPRSQSLVKTALELEVLRPLLAGTSPSI
mmetsp:Transcript_110677/g.191838  ORF Transcript_110677/g.191838 Transcript_110677/m.191838 type:complete len:81 (+) Transcript_110677:365-607(+)